MLTKALEVACRYHKDQIDKIGLPYIYHPINVLVLLEQPYIQEEAITAILHDVVEDSICTLEILKVIGFSDDVINAVDAITRRPNEIYFEYIERCSKNQIAKKVKIADVKHNLYRSNNFNIEITEDLKKEFKSMTIRYQKTLKFLQGE